MTAVIVGGDYIRQIEKIMTGNGVKRVEHWSGRKPGDLRKRFPKDTRLVVMLCDYLSHSLARKVKEDAEHMGLPILYCRRSLGQFCKKFHEFVDSEGFAGTTKEAFDCCRDCRELKEI
jgi:hypothetical protein